MMPPVLKSALVVVALALIAGFVWQCFVQDDFNLPRNGETTTRMVRIDEEGQVVSGGPGALVKNTVGFEEREIMETDGVKHSVPLSEILGGGPQKDGIPSIDTPKFVSVKGARSFLNDEEQGIAVSLNGIDRFYPFQILVWHEIVNDTFPSMDSTSSPHAGSGQVDQPWRH